MKKIILALVVCCLFISVSSAAFAASGISVNATDYAAFMKKAKAQLKNHRMAKKGHYRVDTRAKNREFMAHYKAVIADAKQRLRDFKEYVSIQKSSIENTKVKLRDSQDIMRRNKIVLRDQQQKQKDVSRSNKEKLRELRLKMKELNSR